MAVTVKQIAELANVSRGTVDRVLNNRSGVSEATRQKVLKIAKELHYEPNFLAKALVSKKESLKIGVILTPDYNPFIHDIISGINRAKKEFSAFGIEVIIKLMTSLDPSEEIRIINDLTENGVSGMAVFPLDHPNVYALLNSLIEKGIAVITFNSPAPEVKSLCFIGQDHYKGGRTAAGLMCKILPKDARSLSAVQNFHAISKDCLVFKIKSRKHDRISKSSAFLKIKIKKKMPFASP